MRLTWVQPEDLAPHALVQAAAEGVDVQDLRHEWSAAGGTLAPSVSGASEHPATPAVRRLAEGILERIDERTPRDPALEPAPAARAGGAAVPFAADLGDRLHGGWLGRAVGCLIGKPVEKIPREGIEAIARGTGRWPVTGYFTAHGLDPATAARWPWNRRSAPTSLVETIDGMPEDDDLNFTVLALRLVEAHGTALTTEDVAQAWLDQLPAGRVFTAERVAYRNLLLGVDPADAAWRANPFRHWIGALIRADGYGWTHPGDPSTAATLAAQDARLSHSGPGLEGARWAAALAAAAPVSDGLGPALDTARSVLGPGALAEAVDLGRDLARSGRPTRGALDVLHERYGSLHWVHVLPNAAVIAYALEVGGADLGRSVGIAVAAGWDTDSAGATVGGTIGALLGADALPADLVRPLDDRLATSLPGPPELSVSALAARTLELARGVRP